MKQPNIVLLTTHDTGQHISPYGIKTVQTPNCERLAAQSVLFENSFCTAPQCSPSRAAIATGRYPHANGTLGLTHNDFGWGLHPNERPIAQLLKDAGYTTWLMGFQHETADAEALGFVHVDLGFTLLEASDHLRPMLDQHNDEAPFYCQIGCFETHRPFDGDNTEPDDSLGIHVPHYLVDGPQTRDELRKMQGLIRRFDIGLGRLLDLLDEKGCAENTIFVLTTDHGLALPMAKGTLFDPGIETMLIIRYPERWSAGVRQPELVSNVDILPTLLEAVGAPIPENIQGHSFLALLDSAKHPSRSPRTAIFAEKTFHDCYDPIRCVRTDSYKYIRYFEKNSLHPVPGDISGNGAHLELGPTRRVGSEGFYDLTADPHETTNLADDPAHQSILNDLRQQLWAWMQDTADPLTQGPIASPYYHKAITDLKTTS